MRASYHVAVLFIGIGIVGQVLGQDRPGNSAATSGKDRESKAYADLKDIELLRDIEYGKGGARPLKLDILRPKSLPKEPMPVLVYIHGGGWYSGNKSNGLPRLAPFAQKGYFCASIEYRFSSEAIFPAQIEDCKCAIRFLRAKAKEYHLDPDHIGVWGTSAGGHLVALLGTSAGVKELEGTGGWPEFSSRVQAVCDCCGPADFLLWGERSHPVVAKLLGGPVGSQMKKAALAGPVTHVAGKIPPFLILHGDKDTVVPLSQSESLDKALRNAAADVTLHVVKDGTHDVLGPSPQFDATTRDKLIGGFFDKHLKIRGEKRDGR